MNAGVRSAVDQIGLSIVSLLPQSILFGYGLWYAQYVAREAGYGGLQLIPFWTHSGYHLESLKYGVPVLSYEGSWSGMYFDDRTMWGRIRRFDPGILLDTALFGTQGHVGGILDTCLKMFPEAVRIDVDPYGVREISPHHRMSRDQWICYQGGVAFDTYHVFELPFIDSEVSALDFLLDLLSNERVEIVHIQFRDAEKLLMFLSGRDEVWRKNLSFESLVLNVLSRGISDMPIIIEIHPMLLPFARQSRIQVLRSVRERVQSALNP